MKRTKMTPNIYVEKDGYYEMIIFKSEKRGCGELCRCKVSIEDLPRLGLRKWGVDGRGYVRDRSIKIHQFILGIKKGKEIDHINGDILDNRIENLRYVTHQQNMFNMKPSTKRPYRGVSWDKTRGKWKSEIMKDGKAKYLGRYELLNDAIESRKRAEKIYFR